MPVKKSWDWLVTSECEVKPYILYFCRLCSVEGKSHSFGTKEGRNHSANVKNHFTDDKDHPGKLTYYTLLFKNWDECSDKSLDTIIKLSDEEWKDEMLNAKAKLSKIGNGHIDFLEPVTPPPSAKKPSGPKKGSRSATPKGNRTCKIQLPRRLPTSLSTSTTAATRAEERAELTKQLKLIVSRLEKLDAEDEEERMSSSLVPPTNNPLENGDVIHQHDPSLDRGLVQIGTVKLEEEIAEAVPEEDEEAESS